MAIRSDAVEAILNGADRFSESAIGVLEDNVKAQVAHGTYDFEANKALVKLYQFAPYRCRPDLLALVFAKAMMARPATDANALRCICPEALAESTSLLRRLNKCDVLLDAAKFAEFWEEARASDGEGAIIELVPDLADALRRFIIGLLAKTFANVSVDLVAEVLGISKDEARRMSANPTPESLIAPSTDPSIVRFIPNESNQPRQQRLSETVDLDTLLSLYGQDNNILKAASVPDAK